MAFISINFSSCKPSANQSNAYSSGGDTSVLLDWNINFGPGYDAHGRDTMRQAYENWVNHYIDSASSQSTPRTIRWTFCPCDSGLANIYVTIGAAGGSIPPPPPNPPPGPTGDYALSNNLPVSIPEALQEGKYNDSAKYTVPGDPKSDTTVLAVIDTGLDTTAFKGKSPEMIWANNMLWMDRDGPTLFDVIPGDPTTTLNDENHVKHGTAATAFALLQFREHRKPKVMTIKSFDQHGKGSVYTVSCAMSYAIQKNVKAINASWGYDSDVPDTILAAYFKLANQRNIAVFVAAGNDPHLPHTSPYNKDTVVLANELKERHLFFPACFSDRMKNVVTVTGLNKTDSGIRPCQYQYYSNAYVNLGVLNTNDCCVYYLPFLGSAVEGTSFATPVATGAVMQLFMRPPPGMALNLQDTINQKLFHYNEPFYNKNGKVIKFQNNFLPSP